MKKNVLKAFQITIIKNAKAISLLGLSFYLFFGIAKSANAANYYVTNAGNNNCDGKSQTIGVSGNCAWKTLGKVNATSFNAGDNIYFKRGDTWYENLLIPSSGNAGSPITFGAYGSGNKPVFDGRKPDGTNMVNIVLDQYYGLIRGSGKDHIIIDNIRVQNSGLGDIDENTGIGFNGGTDIIVQNCEINNTESAGIKMNTSSNVKVLHNDVTMTNCHDASEQISLSAVNGFEVAYNNSYTNCDPTLDPPGGAGIDSKQGSKNGTIHHNKVWDINGGNNGIYVDAFNIETFNIQVYANYVHNVSAAGIMIGAEQGGALHDVTVHHNIIHHAARGGLVFHNVDPTGEPVEKIYIYNNTLYLNGTSGTNYYGGVRIFDNMLATDGAIFKNNILASAHNFQIGTQNSIIGNRDVTVLDYNVISGSNINLTGGFTTLTGSNPIISTNPFFTNASNNDFTLQSNSPAKDACDNSVWAGTPNIKDYNDVAITDGSGNIVAPGGRVDCGAFEYNNIPTVDTTPPNAPTGIAVR